MRLLGRIVVFLAWGAALAGLRLASILQAPGLFAYRPVATLAVLVISVAAAVLAWRGGRKLLCLIWVAVLATALWGEGRFQYDRYAVRHAVGSDLAALRVLGPHFMVGYLRADDVLPLAGKGLIGGVFFTRRNAEDKNASQIGGEIRRLQAARRAAGLPPLWVSTDQEGGAISRLSPPLTEQPPLSLLADAKMPAERVDDLAYAYGAAQGQALAALGVNVDFSPVVDLRPSGPENPLDLHTRIARRAISADPDVVSRVALAYARGLEAQGVVATAKHFPGLGGVADDTHRFSASLKTPRAGLEAADWRPFRHVLAHSRAWLMLGHVNLDAVDPENPVSHSAKVVRGILRAAWGYDGILITDDMTMGAIYNTGLCPAVEKSLNAGVDMVLVSYDTDKTYDALACALRAYREGRLDKAELARSGERLGRARSLGQGTPGRNVSGAIGPGSVAVSRLGAPRFSGEPAVPHPR